MNSGELATGPGWLVDDHPRSAFRVRRPIGTTRSRLPFPITRQRPSIRSTSPTLSDGDFAQAQPGIDHQQDEGAVAMRLTGAVAARSESGDFMVAEARDELIRDARE